MAIVEPGKGRAVIEQSGAGLRITIPAETRLFTTAFLGLWMIGWVFGEVTVVHQLFYGLPESRFPAPASFFLLAWLALWTLGGGWCVATLLWNASGKEIIELNSMTLKRIKQIPIFSRSREYKVANIANLRPAPPMPTSWYDEQDLSSLTFKEGAITFDYGRATYHLGTGLDEADAKYVIGEMCRQVKSLCSSEA